MRWTFDEVVDELRIVDQRFQNIATELGINVSCGPPMDFYTGDKATAQRFCTLLHAAKSNVFREASWTEHEFTQQVWRRAVSRSRGRRSHQRN